MFDYITVQACTYAPTRIQADGVPPLEFDGPQAAYEQAQDSAQIMFHAADFSVDLNLERDIRVKFKGGYDCFFSNNLQSAGVLLGNLAVKNGTVALENVRFK